MPVRVADPSAPNIQAGEKRGEIAAHKYEGVTNFQRPAPRSRRSYAEAAAGGIIHSVEEALSAGMGQKERDNEIISVDISVPGQLLARGSGKMPRKSSEARKKKNRNTGRGMYDDDQA
jgi:hypothetical protein